MATTKTATPIEELRGRRTLRQKRGAIRGAVSEAAYAVSEIAYAARLVAEISTTYLETSLIEARLEQEEELKGL